MEGDNNGGRMDGRGVGEIPEPTKLHHENKK